MTEYEHPYPSPELEQTHPFVELDFERIDTESALERATRFRSTMDRRRSVRMFSDDPVPRSLIARPRYS